MLCHEHAVSAAAVFTGGGFRVIAPYTHTRHWNNDNGATTTIMTIIIVNIIIVITVKNKMKMPHDSRYSVRLVTWVMWWLRQRNIFLNVRDTHCSVESTRRQTTRKRRNYYKVMIPSYHVIETEKVFSADDVEDVYNTLIII